MAGEGALVAEAAGEGDVGDGFGGACEEVHGVFDAGAEDEPLGSGAEDSADAGGELGGGEPAGAGEGVGADWFTGVGVEVVEGAGDFGVVAGGLGAWGGFEIAGDAGDAEDVAVVAGADGVFASEAPAAAAVRVEVEVETVEDGAAFADDAFVLFAVVAGEGGGEEIGGDAAGEVVGVAAAAASG